MHLLVLSCLFFDFYFQSLVPNLFLILFLNIFLSLSLYLYLCFHSHLCPSPSFFGSFHFFYFSLRSLMLIIMLSSLDISFISTFFSSFSLLNQFILNSQHLHLNWFILLLINLIIHFHSFSAFSYSCSFFYYSDSYHHQNCFHHFQLKILIQMSLSWILIYASFFFFSNSLILIPPNLQFLNHFFIRLIMFMFLNLNQFIFLLIDFDFHSVFFSLNLTLFYFSLNQNHYYFSFQSISLCF